jgi:hypothetical protein
MLPARQKPKDCAVLIIEAAGGDLKQGDFIPPETIENTTGIQRDHRDYGLVVMQLRKAIEGIIESKTGRLILTRQSDAGIRFLTTSEAAKHGCNRVESNRLASEYWFHRTGLAVDKYLDELSSQERERYEEKRHFNQRMLLHQKQMEIESLPDPFEEDENEGQS